MPLFQTIVVEAWALPAQTTNQQAELVALILACQWAKGQSLNLYRDSKYDFHILLFHAAIWKEKWLLTMKGGFITNSDQIMARIEASHLSMAIGIVHYWSDQANNFIISKGNKWANEAARAAAFGSLGPSHIPWDTIILQLTYLSQLQILNKLYPICISSFCHALSHFIKTYLQPTSEDLSCIKLSLLLVKYAKLLIPPLGIESLPQWDWQLDSTHMPTVRQFR